MKQTTHSVAPEPRGQRHCNRRLILALLFAGRAFAIQFPSDAGVIDVTAPPYNAPHYAMVNGSCAQGASSAGDATSAIQSAMWAAATLTGYPAQIVYLPNGCYKVSNTIWWQSCNDGETPSNTCENAFL